MEHGAWSVAHGAWRVVVALGYEIGPRFDWICKHSWIISLSALAQNDLEENPIGSIQFSLGKRW